MSVARRHTIIPESQRCTGCRRCQLICSLQHTGKFNTGKAHILIAEDDHRVVDITFTDECDTCGVCVQYCVYAALKFRREV